MGKTGEQEDPASRQAEQEFALRVEMALRAVRNYDSLEPAEWEFLTRDKNLPVFLRQAASLVETRQKPIERHDKEVHIDEPRQSGGAILAAGIV